MHGSTQADAATSGLHSETEARQLPIARPDGMSQLLVQGSGHAPTAGSQGEHSSIPKDEEDAVALRRRNYQHAHMQSSPMHTGSTGLSTMPMSVSMSVHGVQAPGSGPVVYDRGGAPSSGQMTPHDASGLGSTTRPSDGSGGENVTSLSVSNGSFSDGSRYLYNSNVLANRAPAHYHLNAPPSSDLKMVGHRDRHGHVSMSPVTPQGYAFGATAAGSIVAIPKIERTIIKSECQLSDGNAGVNAAIQNSLHHIRSCPGANDLSSRTANDGTSGAAYDNDRWKREGGHLEGSNGPHADCEKRDTSRTNLSCDRGINAPVDASSGNVKGEPVECEDGTEEKVSKSVEQSELKADEKTD